MTINQHPLYKLLSPFTAAHAVDLTAFIGQWPTRLQINADAVHLIAMADAYSLTGICVSHIASLWGYDTRSGNEALLIETKVDERLWPFVILNPEEESWKDELQWAITVGMRGVRIAPGVHGYSLLSRSTLELLALIRERGLPLSICVRVQDERLEHPRLRSQAVPYHEIAEFMNIAEGYPMVWSGLSVSEWGLIEPHVTDRAYIDDAISDIWYTNGPIAGIAALCREQKSHRFAYGSCYPIQTAEATAMQLATADISLDDRLKLCRNNALRLMRGENID